MNMMAVPFHGNSLYVVNHNGEPYVPMKPVVAGMGLAWQSQLAKLRQRFASTITDVVNPRKMSVMEELNQACADMKRDKNIASVFATGLNEWKQVKAAHVSKIRTLVNEANMLIDFVLADTGKGKITKAD